MDPRKLLYLATVIEHGSLKKAACALQISQPALSTSMDRFEKSLGERLLHRGPAGVSPTALGKLLYMHARLIREELERADRRVVESPDRGDNAIAFGTLPSLATSIVAKGVAQWRRTHDQTALLVIERNQLELMLALLRGEVDFILGVPEYFDLGEDMIQRVLFRDKLLIIARTGHPLFDGPTPTWQDLASYPWISQVVTGLRTQLHTLLASKNVSLPLQLTECVSVGFIKASVAQTDSLALLPACAVRADVLEGRIMPVDISDPLLNRDIAVLFRDTTLLTSASRALIDHLKSAGIEDGGDQLVAGTEAAP